MHSIKTRITKVTLLMLLALPLPGCLDEASLESITGERTSRLVNDVVVTDIVLLDGGIISGESDTSDTVDYTVVNGPAAPAVADSEVCFFTRTGYQGDKHCYEVGQRASLPDAGGLDKAFQSVSVGRYAVVLTWTDGAYSSGASSFERSSADIGGSSVSSLAVKQALLGKYTDTPSSDDPFSDKVTVNPTHFSGSDIICGDGKVHSWGENDKMGIVGQVFSNATGDQVEYLRLKALGSDQRYWYFPDNQQDNEWWTYLGTEPPGCVNVAKQPASTDILGDYDGEDFTMLLGALVKVDDGCGPKKGNSSGIKE